MISLTSASLDCFSVLFVHLNNGFMRIEQTCHDFYDNVVIPAIYTHILPNENYCKYRVIMVSKPKISCNIVWTLKKDIAEGWYRHGEGATEHWYKVQTNKRCFANL